MTDLLLRSSLVIARERSDRGNPYYPHIFFTPKVKFNLTWIEIVV